VQGILIIVLLFGVLWFVMIRPQRAKVQAQQRMLGTVSPGDEILTVGGIYGIVQELESDEDGGDLIVEIADGIHVRIARKALATVIKPEDDEDEDDDAADDDADGDDADDDDVVDGMPSS
jgi:preprotein translocase subunit YajC